MDKENRIKRKQIIQKIGILESQIRALGKQLEELENPSKLDPYEPPKLKASEKITKDKLQKLAPHYTNEEMADMLGVSVYTIRRYKSNWRIKGKNKKPGPERKNA